MRPYSGKIMTPYFRRRVIRPVRRGGGGRPTCYTLEICTGGAAVPGIWFNSRHVRCRLLFIMDDLTIVMSAHYSPPLDLSGMEIYSGTNPFKGISYIASDEFIFLHFFLDSWWKCSDDFVSHDWKHWNIPDFVLIRGRPAGNKVSEVLVNVVGNSYCIQKEANWIWDGASENVVSDAAMNIDLKLLMQFPEIWFASRLLGKFQRCEHNRYKGPV